MFGFISGSLRVPNLAFCAWDHLIIFTQTSAGVSGIDFSSQAIANGAASDGVPCYGGMMVCFNDGLSGTLFYR